MLPLGSRFSRLVFPMNSDLPIRHSAFTWRVDRLVAVVLYAASVITVSVFLMHGWGGLCLIVLGLLRHVF